MPGVRAPKVRRDRWVNLGCSSVHPRSLPHTNLQWIQWLGLTYNTKYHDNGEWCWFLWLKLASSGSFLGFTSSNYLSLLVPCVVCSARQGCVLECVWLKLEWLTLFPLLRTSSFASQIELQVWSQLCRNALSLLPRVFPRCALCLCRWWYVYLNISTPTLIGAERRRVQICSLWHWYQCCKCLTAGHDCRGPNNGNWSRDIIR